MSSFRDLYENYDKYKDMTEEELCELIGPWWAHMFIDSQEDIRKVRATYKGKDSGDKKCESKDYCDIKR